MDSPKYGSPREVCIPHTKPVPNSSSGSCESRSEPKAIHKVHGRRNLTDQELELAMQAILPLGTSTGQDEATELSDTSFDDIAHLLQEAGREEYSFRPRTYAVLRMVNMIHLMDDFVSSEFWDIELPYAYNTLPNKLSPSQRHRFLEKQDLVLTKAARIEGGAKSTYANFRKDADTYLESLDELGKGGYGSVDRVRSKLSRKIYVRKRMSRSSVFDQDRKALKIFKNEIDNLRRLTHHHLIHYVRSYTDPRFVGILMEPVADCDLQAFLNRTSFSPPDFVCIRQAFGCLCAAIMCLQEKNCRHKDIKPQNILVKGAKVYITDFGLARDWTGKGRSTTTGAAGAFSPDYAAPEVVEEQPRNSSSDIWSLGCVFLDMVTILKYEKLSSKRAYFENNGSLGTNPRTNQEAYKGWMKQLQSVHDNYPLEWVNNMIRIQPKSRLTPQQLMSQIIECDDDQQYYGICCDGQEDTALPAELMNSESEEGITSEDSSADQLIEKKLLDTAILEKRLCKAVKAGDITSTKKWLRKISGAIARDGQSPASFKTRALHDAARIGNEDVADLLIHFGCNLETKLLGQTPLIVAASCSQEGIISLLVKNGAMLDSRDEKTSGTALHFAAAEELHMAIQSLLEGGANVNATEDRKSTPLHLVAKMGDLTGTKLLLEHGAQVFPDVYGLTALNYAAHWGFEDVVNQLLDHGAEIDYQAAPTYYTALHDAAFYNRPAIVQVLIQRGADINLKSGTRHGGTALHLAASKGHLGVLEVLLKWSPNLESRDKADLTPLYVAAMTSKDEAVQTLLKANADVNAICSKKETAFSEALSRRNLGICQLLLDHGANMEWSGPRGEKLLHHVTSWDEPEILLFMLKNKADIEVYDAFGITPLTLAAERSCAKSLKILLEHGAWTDPRARVDGRTALHMAAVAGSAEGVSLLLKHGANPAAQTNAGVGPLVMAIHHQHHEVSQLIRQALEDAIRKLEKPKGLKGQPVKRLDSLDEEESSRRGKASDDGDWETESGSDVSA